MAFKAASIASPGLVPQWSIERPRLIAILPFRGVL